MPPPPQPKQPFSRRAKGSKTGAQWHLSELDDTSASGRQGAIIFVADALMAHLLRGTPTLFSAWKEKADGISGVTPSTSQQLAAFVSLVFGTQAKPKPDDHAEGAVAEILWKLAMEEISPADVGVSRVIGPDLQVTSPGGDGLVIHRQSWDNELFFRLWESKKHTKKSGISGTVLKALSQLSERATQYLAQYTVLASEETDSEHKHLLSRLVEHWVENHEQASAGCSITTDHCPKRAFTNAKSRVPATARSDSLVGLVNSIPKYSEFVVDVRGRVWSGL